MEYSLAKRWINEGISEGILNIDSWSLMALATHLNWWISDLEYINWIYLNWQINSIVVAMVWFI